MQILSQVSQIRLSQFYKHSQHSRKLRSCSHVLSSMMLTGLCRIVSNPGVANGNPFNGNLNIPSSIVPELPATEPEKPNPYYLPPPAQKPHFSNLNTQSTGLNPEASVFTPFKNFRRKRTESENFGHTVPTASSPPKHKTHKASLSRLADFLKAPFLVGRDPFHLIQ